MKMRTFIGLCAALAFAAGSTTVHALKIVSNTNDDPAKVGSPSNTYAKETLTTGTTKAADKSDTTKYYNIAHEDILLSAAADITAAKGDTYIVSYMLDGMVFQNKVESGVLTLPAGGGTFTVAAGGASGDKAVAFRLVGPSSEIKTTGDLLVLSAEFAISVAGSGSVTRTVRNQTLANLNIGTISGTRTRSAPGVIKLGSGLTETAKAESPTATVANSFRSFNGQDVATVGSLQVTFNALVRGADIKKGGVITALSNVIDTGDTGDVPNSTVSIVGEFSFATKAFLDVNKTCSGPGEDILKREGTGDDAMVTGVKPQKVTAFGTAQYLCIMVDPDDEDGMSILETAPYTAMGNYAKIQDAAFDPTPVMQTLGRITRDGTTVNFPFLTSQPRYNQVLRVTNRGGDAPYTFSSDNTDDETVGTFMGGGMTKQLKIRTLIGDRVSGTSGTLLIEAEESNIDVAIVHVNRHDSSTDTVIYE